MSLSGALRSYNAAVRRAERAAAKRSRESLRREKAHQKQLDLDNAESEVESYEDLMAGLLGFHQEQFNVIGWSGVYAEPPPNAPIRDTTISQRAEKELAEYRPGFFQRLFKLEASERLKLSQNVTAAMEMEAKQYAEQMKAFEQRYTEWQLAKDFAKRILDGDSPAYNELIEQTEPFDELKGFGAKVSIEIVNAKTLLVSIKFKGDSLIPTESKELLKSGKLSVKKIPAAKFNALFQDHICSALLGVAGELMALLPIETVFVNAIVKMLDPSTGHMKDSVIVSAMIPKATLNQINLPNIDPSDAMKNFKCNMDFKPASGFKPVDEIRYGKSEVA